MPTVRGKSEVMAYRAAIPRQLDAVLRGAARAGGKVVADEIKLNTPSNEVRENVRLRTKEESSRIVVRIDVKDRWARAVGIWLEYGTSPHFISVDDSQRRGMSIGRINSLSNEPDKGHSLIIGGNFVGKTVWHPGARAHPTFRPAIDTKEADAFAEANAYIRAHVSRTGIIAPAGDDA